MVELKDWGGESSRYRVRQVQQESDHVEHGKHW